MTHSQKNALLLTCILAGSAVAFLVYYFVWSEGVLDSNVDYGRGFHLFWSVAALLLGAMIGAVIGSVVVMFIPKAKTNCIFCGSQRAVLADKTFWTDRPYPNHCPDCGRTWETDDYCSVPRCFRE